MKRSKDYGAMAHWSEKEDTALRTFIGDRQNFEKGFWQDAAEALGTQVNRGLTMSAINFAKSCRLRWEDHLRPGLDLSEFGQQEDAFIIERHHYYHSTKRLERTLWADIARELTREKLKWQQTKQTAEEPLSPCIRSDNSIKNRWNSFLKLPPAEREAKAAKQAQKAQKKAGIKRSNEASDDTDQGKPKRQRTAANAAFEDPSAGDAERPGAPEPWEARDYLFQQRQPETLLPRHPEMHAGGSGAKGTWEASLDASGMSVTYYYIPPHPGPDAAVPPLAPQATTTLDGYSGAPQGGGKRNTYGAELGLVEPTNKRQRHNASPVAIPEGVCQPAWRATPQQPLPQLPLEGQPGLAGWTEDIHYQPPQNFSGGRTALFDDFAVLPDVRINDSCTAGATEPGQFTPSTPAAAAPSQAEPRSEPVWQGQHHHTPEGVATSATHIPQPDFSVQSAWDAAYNQTISDVHQQGVESGSAHKSPAYTGTPFSGYGQHADAAATPYTPSTTLQPTEPEEAAPTLPTGFGSDFANPFAQMPEAGFDSNSKLLDIMGTPEGAAPCQKATDFKQMTSQQMNRWQRDPTKGYGTQRNDTIVDSVVSIGKPAEEGYFDPPHSYQDHDLPVSMGWEQAVLRKRVSAESDSSSTYNLLMDPVPEALQSPTQEAEDFLLQQNSDQNHTGLVAQPSAARDSSEADFEDCPYLDDLLAEFRLLTSIYETIKRTFSINKNKEAA